MAKMEGREKIQKALELLNDAARNKSQELSELLMGRYDHAKEAFSDAIDKGKEAATQVDEAARKRPWHFMGGAAAFGFLVGLLCRRKRR